MGVNKVILIGNLGKDPETSYMKSNTLLTKFPLATNESYKNSNGEKVENTEWHNIILWGKTAEIAGEYLKKGAPVYIEGKLRTRSWEKDGVKRYITEVIGERIQLLGSKPDSEEDTPPPHDEDDLPF